MWSRRSIAAVATATALAACVKARPPSEARPILEPTKPASEWTVDEYFEYGSTAAKKHPAGATASLQLFLLFADVNEPRRIEAEKLIRGSIEALEAEILPRARAVIERVGPRDEFFRSANTFEDERARNQALQAFAAVGAKQDALALAGEAGEIRLIELLAREGDPDGARDLFLRSRQRTQEAGAFRELVRSFVNAGRTSEAEELLVHLDESQKIDGVLGLADAEFESGEAAAALQRLRGVAAVLERDRPDGVAGPDGEKSVEFLLWENDRKLVADALARITAGANAASARERGSICGWVWLIEDDRPLRWDDNSDVGVLTKLTEQRRKIRRMFEQEHRSPLRPERARCSRS